MRAWVLGFAGFSLALILDSALPFMLLLALSTLALGLRQLDPGRGVSGALASSAAGDLLLALAFTVRLASGEDWRVPDAGAWDEGSNLLAGAAMLKLWGGSLAPRYRAGTHSILWWQGAFLAWSAGAPAGVLLAISAIGFACWAIYLGVTQRANAPLVGAAIVSALVAIGAPALAPTASTASTASTALAAVGLAAFAFELGNRTASLWNLAILPLSAASLVGLTASSADPFAIRAPELAIGVALVVPLLWGGTAATLAGLQRVAPFGGGLALASVALTYWFAASASAVPAGTARIWLLYLLLLVVGVWRIAAAITRGAAVPSVSVGHLGPTTTGVAEAAIPQWAVPAGVILMALWAVVTLRLLFLGLSTGFL